MEKYLRALPVLTAVSEQTKAMVHLDVDDTKHHKDNSQGAKEAEGVRKIINVINNQMINPFMCEEQELMNISMGHLYTWSALGKKDLRHWLQQGKLTVRK